MNRKSLTISDYKAGRFTYIMKDDWAIELWDFLSNPEQIISMITATNENKPAIFPLLSRIEKQFRPYLQSSKYNEDDAVVFVNNMIKQIMEYQGYEHSACGLCPQADIIKVSGLYRRQSAAV